MIVAATPGGRVSMCAYNERSTKGRNRGSQPARHESLFLRSFALRLQRLRGLGRRRSLFSFRLLLSSCYLFVVLRCTYVKRGPGTKAKGQQQSTKATATTASLYSQPPPLLLLPTYLMYIYTSPSPLQQTPLYSPRVRPHARRRRIRTVPPRCTSSPRRHAERLLQRRIRHAPRPPRSSPRQRRVGPIGQVALLHVPTTGSSRPHPRQQSQPPAEPQPAAGGAAEEAVGKVGGEPAHDPPEELDPFPGARPLQPLRLVEGAVFCLFCCVLCFFLRWGVC